MIRKLRFRNYRVLRDAELPLQPFTLLVGPNGSGKSTVLHALKSVREVLAKGSVPFSSLTSVFAPDHPVEIEIDWAEPLNADCSRITWKAAGRPEYDNLWPQHGRFLNRIKVYSLSDRAAVQPALLEPEIQMLEDGSNLAAVLDQMRDQSPEALEGLNLEISHLLPEFNRVLFETTEPGKRAFLLRTREGHHAIRAADLSQGTVLALAILTLAHLSDPPSMVCLEEPDRGIHPRLYREIQDALYRLAYPESFGLERDPVQVLVTTHSPYLLDLHRDHPEEVVIAQKNGTSATFHRLSDREDIDELLSEASLGELWYSGVLGGVPAAP